MVADVRAAQPSRRLWALAIPALMAAGLVSLLWLIAFQLGYTPAIASEREFIADIKTSPFASHPAVQRALLRVESAPYVSRADFQAVEVAFGIAAKASPHD